ncbi:MAG TPA: type II secretion system protein [Candidatus Ozemobacteraceae bacterium]|nr:type II secretion system protein [Candidatus Ozemobacteraceae bacterium]
MITMRRRAFTLIEVMMALAVVGIFLAISYRLFIGSQRIAGKGTWTSGVIDQMRNALNQLNLSLKSTSYPTTLLSDAIKDPVNGGMDVAKKFFVKLHKDGTVKVANLTGETEIAQWVVCEPEKPPQRGIIIYHRLLLVPIAKTVVKEGEKVAELWIDAQANAFSTTGPKHAESGTLSLTALPDKNRRFRILEDVSEVRFTVPSALPALDPQPIKIELRCQYPRDVNTFKENSLMITPNVGVDNL